MTRRSREPRERRQQDLLNPPCPTCHGTGKEATGCAFNQLVNYYRIRKGLKPLGRVPRGGIDYHVCGDCGGTGKQGVRPPPWRP